MSMGVYIDMEMPKNGSCIQIVIDDDGNVYPSVEKCILKMGSIAKAVHVLPHGNLIDRDEIIIPFLENENDEKWVKVAIDAAPTVIPASKEE